MVTFIIGAAVGAGVMYAKDYFMGDKQSENAKKAETDTLYAENEKLRQRCKDAERRIEDLVAANQKLMHEAKQQNNDSDDLEDELAQTKSKVRKLQQQNDDLLRKVQEYKQACESYEMEIKKLKQ